MNARYLLIDYENVQPRTLSLLNGSPFKVLVFLGANQSKVSVEFAKALQALGTDAEYIQISGNGSNALDFHIAYTIGELSKTNPSAYYHIISKDTGFDPLITYARNRGVTITRSKEIADIPLLRISNLKTFAEKADAVVRNLTSRGTARPRKLKTLTNTIDVLFLKALEESELKQLIRELVRRKFISFDGENVRYHMPSAP